MRNRYGRYVGRLPMETDDLVLRVFPKNIRPILVLAGGVLCMLTLGIVYTFGNILPYMLSYYRWKTNPNMTAGTMFWLQTLLSGLPMGMVIGGLVERCCNGRKGAIIGCILYTFGIGSTFYAIQHSYAATLLTFGVIGSLGSSITYSSILPTAQRWLPDNVGMAGGVIIGGYGCGAFILSPLQTTYINPLDYRVNDEGFFTQVDLLERVPYVFVVMAALFAILQTIGVIFIGQPCEEVNFGNESLLGAEQQVVIEKQRIAPQLRTSTFIVLFVSLTCNATFAQLTSGLYKAYGQKFIASDFFLSLVGSMSSVFNALSRVVWGIIVDASSYQFSMSIVTTIGAFLSFTLPLVRSAGNDILFMTAVSFMFSCIGGTFSLFPFITHVCFGKTNFSVIYGFLQCAVSVAGLIAGLVSTHLLPMIGYEYLFMISGFFMTMSLALTTLLHKTDIASVRAIGRVQIYESNDEEN
ncbi:unnamed protein product [Caenorhabditis bovis]|uniref:Major facilitator superfamily (MFS) profile domain-containing protein n=1 Tax=Caenorhabditis bovis TaxID=2654633 RepID=A0A8S1ET24_9PELO|nr:unnamed protein product [Caenorhabditis bovis]